MQQRLRRDATHVQAHATQLGIALHQDDLEPQVGSAEGRAVATGATADERFRDLAERAGAEWLLVASGVPSIDVGEVEDLRATLNYAHASVVGRAGEAGTPHRYVTNVSPSPVLLRRDLVAEHGWSLDQQRADAIQSGLVARGHRIYAADLASEQS